MTNPHQVPIQEPTQSPLSRTKDIAVTQETTRDFGTMWQELEPVISMISCYQFKKICLYYSRFCAQLRFEVEAHSTTATAERCSCWGPVPQASLARLRPEQIQAFLRQKLLSNKGWGLLALAMLATQTPVACRENSKWPQHFRMAHKYIMSNVG